MSAQKRYERVVNRIATGTSNAAVYCPARELLAKYPEFFEYLRLLSLAWTKIMSSVLKCETRFTLLRRTSSPRYLTFSLTPPFLRAVSRFETLPQAKAQLRQMNAARAATISSFSLVMCPGIWARPTIPTVTGDY